MPRPELTLVIPIYNEEEVLPQLDVRLKKLLEALAIDTEVLFVNDGSKDKSIDILRRLAAYEPRYKVISFSRNFGHQRAITAGMDKSRGRAVVVMDADLQDPPEVILEMVERWKQGFDVVYGRRRSREGESWFKLVTAKWFYRVFAALIPIEVPLDAGDFRLMSRRVVTTLRGLRETHRFVRGLVAWVGFKQTAVEYDRAARAAGETKYPLKKMLAFAIDGIASFSIQPLRFASYVGVLVGGASVLYAIASVITWFAGMNVSGWTTTIVLVSFLFSVQFFMIGVLGEYVGRIYEQSKRRPLYILSERINFGSVASKKTQHLRTRDLEEMPALPPTSARTPSVPPALPQRASTSEKTTSDSADKTPSGKAGSVVPPPPAAVLQAGAAAEASIARMPAPTNRRSVTPAPPLTQESQPPPPLKLASSLSGIAAAEPFAPAPSGRSSVVPRRPSYSAIPHPLPRTTTPSTPPVSTRTPSTPPVSARSAPPPSVRSAPPPAVRSAPSPAVRSAPPPAVHTGPPPPARSAPPPAVHTGPPPLARSAPPPAVHTGPPPPARSAPPPAVHTGPPPPAIGSPSQPEFGSDVKPSAPHQPVAKPATRPTPSVSGMKAAPSAPVRTTASVPAMKAVNPPAKAGPSAPPAAKAGPGMSSGATMSSASRMPSAPPGKPGTPSSPPVSRIPSAPPRPNSVSAMKAAKPDAAKPDAAKLEPPAPATARSPEATMHDGDDLDGKA